MGNDLMVDDAAMPYPEEADRDAAFVRLGGRFDEALAFAAEMHREQARKGIPVPYLSHLLGVASLVLEYGGDEDQAIAALLHDTLEDCGTEHAPAIGERFGPDVLALVRACSDDEVPAGTEKRPWRVRKEGYLAHPAVLALVQRAASAARVPTQWLIRESEGSDARAVRAARSGVPTALVAIPARRSGGPVSFVHARDVAQTAALLARLLAAPAPKSKGGRR